MYVNIPYTLRIFIPIGFMGRVYLPTFTYIYLHLPLKVNQKCQ